MEAGLQIFNTSNTIQIDSTYSNYVMSAKGSFYTGNGGVWADNVMRYVDIASGKKNSIMAVRCSTNFVVFNSLDGNGNVVHKVLTATAATFEYWIFTSDPPGNTGYGLEVYNAQGVRVFQATEKYLRLLGFYTTPVIANTAGSVGTPGKNAAAVCASYCALWEGATVPIPGGGVISHGILRTLMLSTNSGSVSYYSTTIANFNANRGTSNNAYASFLTIDVDNL